MIKTTKKTLKPNKFKFGLKVDFSHEWNKYINKRIELIIMLDQCVNKANLKFNLLDIEINRLQDNPYLNKVLNSFYFGLRKHGSILQYLKFNLLSLINQARMSYKYKFQTRMAIKSLFTKLTNLKWLCLDIRISDCLKKTQIKAFNELFISIGTNLKRLQSLKIIISYNDFTQTPIPHLIPSWDSIKNLKDLVGFSLQLYRPYFGESTSNIHSLLSILKYHPRLTKFHLDIESDYSSISFWPFRNFSKYFQKLNRFKSLKLDLSFTKYNPIVSYELIKIFQKYPNLKEINLTCGDISHGFTDDIEIIMEYLSKLIRLQNITLRMKFKNGNSLLRLAKAINQMKQLESLDLDIEYYGDRHDLLDHFMNLLKFSAYSLKTFIFKVESSFLKVSSTFWKLFSQVLSSIHTLETFNLSISITGLSMSITDMKIFAKKLSQNLNLSKLQFDFFGDPPINGAGLIYLIMMLKHLKYITHLELYYKCIAYLSSDYYHILQNCLKGKNIKTLKIGINDILPGYKFPSVTIKDIINLFKNINHLIINEIYLGISIQNIAPSEKKILLDIINIKQIRGVEILFKEYEGIFRNNIEIDRKSSIKLSELYTPRLCYRLYEQLCYYNNKLIVI